MVKVLQECLTRVDWVNVFATECLPDQRHAAPYRTLKFAKSF